MTKEPAGWRRTTLGEVASWGSGGTPSAGNRAYYCGEIPWAVIGDLTDGPVSSTRSSITHEGLRSSSAKLVPSGSLLVAMYGSIGKLGITTRTIATNQAIAFATPHDGVDVKFLFYYLQSQRSALLAAGKGATQNNISQAILKSWPVDLPGLVEQRRIADILDDHLSRLDAARDYLASSKRRLAVAHRAILSQIIPDVASYPPDWETSIVGEAGLVELGRQRHPDWHTGPNMRPYLRVANVFEDEIRTDDLKEMHWAGETFERFKVHPGDILLNEGQTPDLLGRPALYRGDPADVAFTNSLIRFQAKAGVLPEFALLVFRRHMHAKRFKRESRITTNIAHLSAARLKTVEFPIPALEEQRRLVAQADSLLDSNRRVREGISQAEARGAALRRAILSAAFAGGLTGRPSDLDRMEELAATGVSA